MDEHDSKLDLTFAALAHPTRRAMLDVLMSERVRVTDLAAKFDCSLNVASKHILSLERAGLIKREQLGREHWLNIDPKPLSGAASFVERYRKLWGNKLDRLGAYLDSMDNAESKPAPSRRMPKSASKSKRT